MSEGDPFKRPSRRDEGIALLLLVLLFAIIAGIGVIAVTLLR
jgi:hypothetical protein